MKKPSQSKAAQGKSKTQSQSHKELIAQITKENRAYLAKLDAEQPIPKPAISRRSLADEIKAQKLKDAETVRQILNAQSHRQTSICPPHPAPDRSAYSSISTGGSLCNQSNRWPRLPETNAKNPSPLMDSGLKKVIWGIAGVLGVLFIIGWISSLHDTGVDNDFAVASAERFVRQAYPGAQLFLPDNHVVHNQDEFDVSLTANGVNSFNAPVQNAFLVIMREIKPGTLRMVEIDQK